MAVAFGLGAVFGSLDDTADFSLYGTLLAIVVLVLALASYGRGRQRHVLVLALIAVSVVLSALDLALAQDWFR
jgi:hypothetical protein